MERKEISQSVLLVSYRLTFGILPQINPREIGGIMRVLLWVPNTDENTLFNHCFVSILDSVVCCLFFYYFTSAVSGTRSKNP